MTQENEKNERVLTKEELENVNGGCFYPFITRPPKKNKPKKE